MTFGPKPEKECFKTAPLRFRRIEKSKVRKRPRRINGNVLEQRTLPSARLDAKVVIRQLRSHASAWSAVQESNLHQEGLVDLFNRIWLFRQCRRQRIHAHRATLVFFDDRQQQSPVDFVEAVL